MAKVENEAEPMSSKPHRHTGPAASGRPDPDAIIVIFGAAVQANGEPSTVLRQRVAAAARFGRRFAAALYIPTGAVGRHGPSEASVMARLLQAAGIPDGLIKLEETGTDTLSSVRAVRRLLRDFSAKTPVFVATSAFHLPRCLALLRLAGVAARPAAPTGTGDRGVTTGYWWLREAAALPYDVALTLWHRLTGTL
jgi:uncharacterized SAM-binding protein YcdF (DUF218 family)